MSSGDKPKTPFDEIVSALGGTNAAAKKLGRRPSQICQWRTLYGRFPAALLPRVQKALKKKRVPIEAFRFDDAAG